MHHIYHTEGLILGSRNFGEAGRHYYIFTRDLGLITASAQGVRKMSSKLRFILQDLAYVKVDLVFGRNIFRVTSASKTNLLERITKNPETFAIFTNISLLLRRLLAGVEPNEALFADLLNGLLLLERTEVRRELKNLEAIIVLRIVHNLGYIGASETLRAFTKSPFRESMVLGVSKSRRIILSEINKALRETHL